MKCSIDPVSYTHLDVYKRQIYLCASDSAAVAEQIRAVHQDHFSHCSIFLHDVKAVEEEMNRTATVISIFFYGFITLITLIGATNIFNTISTCLLYTSRCV